MGERGGRPADGGPHEFSTLETVDAQNRPRPRKAPSLIATVHHPDGDREVALSGGPAWALMQLVAAGSTGCTTLENSATRWSSYVANCRATGVPIETVYERHSGPYAGNHGRYRLRVPVSLREAPAPSEVA